MSQMRMDVQTQRQLHGSPNHQCQDGHGKLIRCSTESGKAFDKLCLLVLREDPVHYADNRYLCSVTFIMLLYQDVEGLTPPR